MPKIMKSLNNISRCQSVFRNARLGGEGLFACYHAYVLVIARMAGCSQDELAKELCLNKSTVTRALAQLEADGYVTRRPKAEDKRCILVYPTEKLLSVLPKVRAASVEWNGLIAAGVSDEELSVFYKVLLQMEQNAKDIAAESREG